MRGKLKFGQKSNAKINCTSILLQIVTKLLIGSICYCFCNRQLHVPSTNDDVEKCYIFFSEFKDFCLLIVDFLFILQKKNMGNYLSNEQNSWKNYMLCHIIY